MPNPYRLVTHSDKSAVQVVEHLRDLLARAEKGEIVSIGTCVVEKSGIGQCGYAGGDHALSLLGTSVHLQQELLEWVKENV